MRDERKCSSASVFEVANANGPNDLTRGNVNSSLQLFADRKKTLFFFSIGQALLHSNKMPLYQTFNKPPGFHLEIPDDIFKLFRAVISFTLQGSWISCQDQSCQASRYVLVAKPAKQPQAWFRCDGSKRGDCSFENNNGSA